MTVYVTPEDSGTVKVNGTTYDSFPTYITVADNSTVSFEAIPADGYKFVNWSGALSGDENPTTHYVTCDISVTANFQASNEPPVADAGGIRTWLKVSPSRWTGRHLTIQALDKFFMPVFELDMICKVI